MREGDRGRPPWPAGAPAGTGDDPQGRDPEFWRAENEDDDGYDPWSDRRPDPEPLWEADPWR